MAKKEEEAAMSLQEGKLKALQAAMSKIEKDFGKGSIMKLGDEQIENVEVIPTGSIGLNAALGVGGYPRGRIMRFTVRNHPVRRRSPSTPSPRHKKPAASPRSLTRNMPSTASMPPSSASTSTTCGFHSPTTVSRPSK